MNATGVAVCNRTWRLGNGTVERGTFSGLWWKKGIADVQSRMRRFFREYQRIGGRPVTELIADTEADLQMHSVLNWPACSPCARAGYDAIEADPRWASTVKPMLDAAGFRYDARYSLAQLMCNVPAVNKTIWAEFNWQRWAWVMRTLNARYYNEGLCDVLAEFYPDALCHEYEFFSWDAAHCVSDINGSPECMVGTGMRVGNVQDNDFYNIARPGVATFLATYRNVSQYDVTNPFNVMRYDVNRFRMSRVADPGTPVKPWVAIKSNPATQTTNSSAWQETVFHLAIGGALDFSPVNVLQNTFCQIERAALHTTTARILIPAECPAPAIS